MTETEARLEAAIKQLRLILNDTDHGLDWVQSERVDIAEGDLVAVRNELED